MSDGGLFYVPDEQQPIRLRRMLAFAPGSRAVIRDEEWLIRRVDPSTDGGWLLTCDGISDLVRGQDALFLTKLEDQIEVLNPAATQLVPDTSPTYNAALLYLESMRRRSVPNDEKVHLGHRGVMNLVPYQLEPALQALKQPRSRILIADAVGLGKTLEAGILATELIQRGRGKRILVVTQKAMLTQFQKEWWSRFSIPLTRLDSVGLARVRNRIPANHNPFNHFDRSIISVDTLKSNLEYRNYLENAWWDVIVIDECHNVAARAADTGLSRRARLAKLLATRSDTLILLSATPHDGSARSFASLMTLLDPTAISDPDDYTPDDFRNKGLVIRRFKKDIKDQVAADFQERETTCLREPASLLEEGAYRALLDVAFTQAGQHKAGKQQELQRVGMQKALFSSPAAALRSTEKRIQLLTAKPNASADEQREVAGLDVLRDALTPLVQDPSAKHFSRYQRLLSLLRSPEFAWQANDANDRLVIFSERIDTLEWLRRQLTADLKLNPGQLELLHGAGMTDTEQQAIVERFGRLEDPIRILLCSDVASEGLNLHYFCHRLVHFDLPFSLMVFQQRNGRVDRYGQKHQPHIVYLFTEAQTERIKGDLRTYEILQRKDQQAYLNLGDPSAFLNVYDPEKEDEKVTGFLADGMTPEQIEAKLDAEAASKGEEDGDFLMQLFGGEAAPAAPESSLANIDEPGSLFESDYHYAKTALTQLNLGDKLCEWTAHDTERIIALTAPRDLQERLRQLPHEVQAENDYYSLCADPARVTHAIEDARQVKANTESENWPQLHYLWPQHPIVEWLGDRVMSTVKRHSAPLLQSPHLQPDEQAFILMSLVPNRKGQPLLVDWRVATRRGEAGPFALEAFDTFAARAGLKAGKLPNRGHLPRLEQATQRLQQALAQAVQTMHAHMLQQQAAFSARLAERLDGTLKDLERLQSRQLEQLKLTLENQLETVKRGRYEQRSQQINRVFDEYRQWVHDTLTTEPQPWIQVLAGVCHPSAAA